MQNKINQATDVDQNPYWAECFETYLERFPEVWEEIPDDLRALLEARELVPEDVMLVAQQQLWGTAADTANTTEGGDWGPDSCAFWEVIHDHLVAQPHPELSPEEISEIVSACEDSGPCPQPSDAEEIREILSQCPQLYLRLTAEVAELCKGEDAWDWEGEWTEEAKAGERNEHYWRVVWSRLESVYAYLCDNLSDRVHFLELKHDSAMELVAQGECVAKGLRQEAAAYLLGAISRCMQDPDRETRYLLREADEFAERAETVLEICADESRWGEIWWGWHRGSDWERLEEQDGFWVYWDANKGHWGEASSELMLP